MTNYPRREVMKFPSGKAGSPGLETLNYPRFGSFKIDGSYCFTFNGELYSRNLILHPNRFLRKRLAPLLDLKDMVFMGELFDPSGEFTDSQSITRSHAADIGCMTMFVFDCLPLKVFTTGGNGLRYFYRYNTYKRMMESLSHEFIQPVYQEMLVDVGQAQILFDRSISAGHEGIVTRDPNAYYKYGRLTARENDCFRHTRFERCDAILLEVVEAKKRRDGVEPPKLLDGRAHRSFKKDDYSLAGTAGSLRVRDEQGREYGVGFGVGWTDARKREVWEQRHKLQGCCVEVEYKPDGMKDLPRQPKLVRFREDKDVKP